MKLQIIKYKQSLRVKTLKLRIINFLIVFFLSFIIYHLSFITLTLASTLALSPSTGTFNRSCSFNLDIILDTQGAGADGVDVLNLNFDSSKFTATTIDTQNKIFSDYPGNNIDNSTGKIVISGLAAFGKPFTGTGKFASVTFSVKDAATTGVTQMTFDFDPNDKTKTSDSNVAAGGVETLNAVTNGSYTIGTGICSGSQVTSGITTAPNVGSGVTSPSSKGGFIPVKTLPQGGTEETTATIAIVGSILTILGILGIVLL